MVNRVTSSKALSKVVIRASHWISGLGRSPVQARLSLLFVGICGAALTSCASQDTTSSDASSPSPATQPGTLTIWWEKGFNLQEDDALNAMVAAWEEKTGHDVDLSTYTTDDLPQKTQRAIEAGSPPDILMSHNAERAVYPNLAWNGKLVDVTDVMEPVKSFYPSSILDAISFFNNVEQKRSYYTLPISQSSTFIFYWRDLVEKAGFSDSDIPTDWDGFWNFWTDVQDRLQDQASEGDPPIYGLGFSLSDRAGDTYYTFEQALEAYGVELLTPDGELHTDDPKVRDGVIQALDWYTRFYKDGYFPPDTVTWLNPDNNNSFLNRQVVMTPNTSLTIPATVREDEAVYRDQLVTAEYPLTPSGEPMRYILTIKQVIIFEESPNQAIAKEFLAYLAQPDTLGNYLKAAGIRNLPVTEPLWNDPFWTDETDPHLSVAAKILRLDQTRPFPSVYHPAYSVVTQENVWGKAINRIVVDNISLEQAADEAIAEINRIFEQWE